MTLSYASCFNPIINCLETRVKTSFIGSKIFSFRKLKFETQIFNIILKQTYFQRKHSLEIKQHEYNFIYKGENTYLSYLLNKLLLFCK
jgi:hypothetical protein